jgi:hypothetical protein
MYKKLAEYKQNEYDTLVPKRYRPDTQFAKWVDTQRTVYMQDEMSDERITLLKKLGFFSDRNL